MRDKNLDSGPSVVRRSWTRSPVPSKPHIWRDDAPRIFSGLPSKPWRCANLARSVVLYAGHGFNPSDAYKDWRRINSGTGRYG